MDSSSVANPTKILALIEELNDLPYKEVQQRLNKYIQNETRAKLVFLALPESKEILIHVIGEEILDNVMKLPNTILYKDVTSDKPSVFGITTLDQELLRYINRIMEAKPRSLLVIPIRHPLKPNTTLLVCLVDYTGEIDSNKKIVEECYRFCLGYLLSSLRCYEEARVRQQCLDLLDTSVNLCAHLYEDLSVLLRKIMAEARKLTNAEAFSLFLLDSNKQELVAEVFDGFSSEENGSEVRIPIGKEIAGYVTNTGEILNIRDAYSSEHFYREIDEAPGFTTRNILCFPIRNEKGIIGVAQVRNKQNGLYFDVFDEQIASAFSFFCGISIMNSINYKKLQNTQNRFKLSNELMMYYMKVNDSDVEMLLNCPDGHSVDDLSNLHFNPRSLPSDHLLCYTIKMFTDLGFFNYWGIEKSTLARFILYVKKGYRDTLYHNWTHAFCVTHFAYLLLKNARLVENNYMTPLEALVFFVSCLCHDIDHRGTTNSYQTNASTLVGAVYSSEGSVMERHHVALTMCILNTENCNIFESLSRDEYKTALELLSSYILATDLATQNREEQKKMISQYNKYDPKQKKTLFGMLMNCCDLSDHTKDWKSSKNVAVKQVYSEFFRQGDLEKSKGYEPIVMMDRERAFIPDLQTKFICEIVIPLYTNLSLLFPSTWSLIDALELNLSLWEVAKSLVKKYSVSGKKSLDILLDPEFDDEVLKMYANRNLP
ncbi:cGMP-dependent 3',5'-cyclic phosphodiesterase-like isoform X2 [Pseudomyrmex gracilis]|uniref:cGMP-dependent 3',5'-cyclic phosphodiesterase-like isoform X2 n=1 Tax=Pseudomyrmex gracilis TaxID=219809 RepID=UPI0009949C3B|nr:cGMP-dependent 3',5'-cyclic phosphodiesterase-like isoform X2 [Pseudomyrmex gracilis]